MNVENVNSLKQQGNKAFSEQKYDEALDFYAEALELVGLEDTKTAAILHSNIAQTYLEKKDYSLAVENATKSLELDPSFMKSNLRRAMGNVELDNLADAMTDLRLIFSSEPKNKAVTDLIRRCSDKPVMIPRLHVTYAKHYLRQVLKKIVPRVLSQKSELNFNDSGACSGEFQNALLRQLFLSDRSINMFMSNCIALKGIVMFPPGNRAAVRFMGWVTRQRMWFGYSHSAIDINVSVDLFQFLYCCFPPGTFSLGVYCFHKRCSCSDGGTLPLNLYSDVLLINEKLLPTRVIAENAVKVMNHYANDITRLLYTPELANFKENRFPKSNALTFVTQYPITGSFLNLWKKNEWPIELVSFIYGFPDLRALKQFNGTVSNKVNTAFVQYAMDNTIFHKVAYNKLCNNLSTLKGAFPNLSNVTIVHKYTSKIWDFPRFVQNMALVHEAYKTVSTKPEWCPKLRVVVFVEFETYSRTKFKTFNVKSLDHAVESLRQKRPDMPIRLCGPRSYDISLGNYDCVHAVVEFENEVAIFELAFYATML